MVKANIQGAENMGDIMINSSQENHDWKSEFEQFCQNLADESLKFGELLSEADQKTKAVLQSES